MSDFTSTIVVMGLASYAGFGMYMFTPDFSLFFGLVLAALTGMWLQHLSDERDTYRSVLELVGESEE